MPTMIYFSARLPVLYPTDAEALFTALEDHNVPYALLDGTKDVWVYACADTLRADALVPI